MNFRLILQSIENNSSNKYTDMAEQGGAKDQIMIFKDQNRQILVITHQLLVLLLTRDTTFNMPHSILIQTLLDHRLIVV